MIRKAAKKLNEETKVVHIRVKDKFSSKLVAVTSHSSVRHRSVSLWIKFIYAFISKGWFIHKKKKKSSGTGFSKRTNDFEILSPSTSNKFYFCSHKTQVLMLEMNVCKTHEPPDPGTEFKEHNT